MADPTAIDGEQISFETAAIVAIADRDVDNSATVTCVYGLAPGLIEITEPVLTFL